MYIRFAQKGVFIWRIRLGLAYLTGVFLCGIIAPYLPVISVMLLFLLTVATVLLLYIIPSYIENATIRVRRGVLRYECGIFWCRRFHIFLSDVRTIAIQQTPVEKNAGLCSMALYAPAGKIRFHCLLLQDAERIKKRFDRAKAVKPER